MNWINRLILSIIFITLTSIAYALPMISDMGRPHFYVQMENDSGKPASIRFQRVTGNVSLLPVLNNHTAILPHQQSGKYGVVFDPLTKTDIFNIVFTGERDCAFSVAFYAPNDPKITISGLGCFGGGYKIDGQTLILYISDITFQK